MILLTIQNDETFYKVLYFIFHQIKNSEMREDWSKGPGLVTADRASVRYSSVATCYVGSF